MSITALNILWLLIGLLAGVIINALADYLPSSSTPLWPQWQTWGWGQRKRPLLVLLSTAVLFFFLPSWLAEPVNLALNSLYIAILILIIVTDLEHKLIFNVVVYPATIFAFIGSFIMQRDLYSWKLAILGAILGFVVFYFFFWLANLLYGGDRVPLGMGDVKLAMMLGMMLGFPVILYCLLWGIVLGGLITLLLLLSRRVSRGTTLPYGQYLALSGIGFLIWGADYVKQLIN